MSAKLSSPAEVIAGIKLALKVAPQVDGDQYLRELAALAAPAGVDEARDARRYRHMRATHRPGPYDKHRLEWYLPRRTRMTAEGLDEAIDAELAALAARDGGA